MSPIYHREEGGLMRDVARSALDTSTEKMIQKALQNLVKGRTSISIAHRLSVGQFCLSLEDLLKVVFEQTIANADM